MLEEEVDEVEVEEEKTGTEVEKLLKLVLFEYQASALGFCAAVCAAVGWHSAGHVGIGVTYTTPSHVLALPAGVNSLQKQYSAAGPSGSLLSQIALCCMVAPSGQAEAPAGGAHTAQSGRSRSAARSAPLMLAPHAAPTSAATSATRATPATIPPVCC